MATVIVGPNKEPFVVYEALLTHYSEFFKAALTGEFKEAKEKFVTLEEEDKYTFEIFVHWLIYQRFPDAKSGDHPDIVDLWIGYDKEDSLITERLIDLYVLGDRCRVSGLKEDTVDGLYYHLRYNLQVLLLYPSPLWHAFEHLPPKSPMCRLLIDMYCFYGYKDIQDDSTEEDLPPVVMHAMLRRYTYLVHGDDSEPGSALINYDLDICDYHNHENDFQKVACRIKQDVESSEVKLRWTTSKTADPA